MLDYNISLQEFPGEICLVLFHDECNLNCGWCFNYNNLNTNLIFSEAKKLIDKHYNFITAICLSGGEPFLSDDVVKVIKYAKEKDLKVKINTNGTCIPLQQINPYDIDLLNISFKPKSAYNNMDLYTIIERIKDHTLTCLNKVEWSFVYHPSIVNIDEILYMMNFIVNLGSYKYSRLIDYRPDYLTIQQLRIGDCLNPNLNSYTPPSYNDMKKISNNFKHIPKEKIIIDTYEFGHTYIYI